MSKKSSQNLVANKKVFDQLIKKASLPIESNAITAKYRGKLPIGEIEVECAVLSDNRRVLSATSVFTAFDRPRKGEYRVSLDDGTKLPPFMASNNLIPFINQDIMKWTIPIKYLDGNRECEGYAAELLPELCFLYLRAKRANKLTHSQQKFAEQSIILLESFAKIGIIALIDEVTGYQYDRTHDALRILLQQYIAEGLQKWMKTFPDEFFVELDRLYTNTRTTSRARPSYYGHFINTYIYDPIEYGYIKQELDKLNIKDNGIRKARFHQWLTIHGKDVLVKQIWRILGIMETSSSIHGFKNKIEKQKLISVAPYLFDEYNNLDESI